MKAHTQPRVRLPVVQQVVYAAHDVPGGSEEVCHCEQLSGFSRASYPKLRTSSARRVTIFRAPVRMSEDDIGEKDEEGADRGPRQEREEERER